jgi:hypothetical protein
MVPLWLQTLAWISLVLGFVSAAIILVDLLRHPQKMAIMNWVWPITALYAGPLALWAYWTIGKGDARDAEPGSGMRPRPFWQSVVVGVSHCGAGCTLGDIIAEVAIASLGLMIVGSMLLTEYMGDYILAFALGIVFQYFAIAPMRGLSLLPGLRAAIKADALSLTAFEIGLFGWMALSFFVLFHPRLTPIQPAYWFMMQIGMLIGFATSYPMNVWLIRRGIKEAM